MDFTLTEIDTKPGSQKGAELALLKLDGNPLLNALKEPITLTVLGSDGDTYQRLNRELGRKRVARLQKMRGTPTDEELDLQQQEDIRLLAQVTTGWSGILDSKKQAIPFTLENAIDLFTKYPVAMEQAQRAVVERQRFIQPSS